MSGQIEVAIRLGFFCGILIDIVSLEILSLFVYRFGRELRFLSPFRLSDRHIPLWATNLILVASNVPFLGL